MTSVLHIGVAAFAFSRVVDMPDFNSSFAGATTSIERLSTEPLGTTTLTLTNVVVGSRYRIERQGDGSLATPTANAEGVAASGTVAITLDYYSAGNANNDLRLKLIDLGYEIEEITFTVSSDGYVIQSQRRPDPWYSNPA